MSEKKRARLKDFEVRLVAELMKKSNRSDRELARALGTSQPTVTRTRNRLEKEGVIQEYTMIPDFNRLGFQLMSVNLVKYSRETAVSDRDKMRKTARRLESERGLPYMFVMQGLGMNYNSVFVMFHPDYSSYATLKRMMTGAAGGNVENFESFLIDLNDKSHFKPVTLSALAGYLLLEKQRASRQATKQT